MVFHRLFVDSRKKEWKQLFLVSVGFFLFLIFFFYSMQNMQKDQQQNQQQKEISQKNISEKYILLSFDVEPVDEEQAVLAVIGLLQKENLVRDSQINDLDKNVKHHFKQHKINATFFVTGEYALKHRRVVQLIEASGFEVTCHSFSHPFFPLLNSSQKRAEIFRCERALQIAGVSFPKGFRSPYAVLDFETANILEKNAFAYDASTVWYLKPLYTQFNKTKEIPISTFFAVPLQDVIWVYYLHMPKVFFWAITHTNDPVISVIFHPHHVQGFLNELQETIDFFSEQNARFISYYHFVEVSNQDRAQESGSDKGVDNGFYQFPNRGLVDGSEQERQEEYTSESQSS